LYHNKLSLYSESGKWSTSDWIESLKLNGQSIVPSYAAISLPYKNYVLSLGYSNYYNSVMKDKLQITTVTQPDGTGEYYEFKDIVKLNTFWGCLNYPVTKQISVGLTIGCNYLSEHEQIYNLKATGHGYGFTIISGMIITPFNDLHLGYVFRYISDCKYDLKIKSSHLIAPTDIDPELYGNNENILNEPDRFPYIARFPNELETGLSYRLLSALQLSGKIRISQWKLNRKTRVDIVTYHLGLQVDPLKQITLNAGYFTQKDPFYSDNYSTRYNMDQKFLTVGMKLQLSHFIAISLNYLDSHLLMDKDHSKFTQRYYSFGLAVTI
jgi:hypothetical protein